MITKEEIIEVGKFLKPHGLKGELNIVTEYEHGILEQDYPLIVEMEGIYVPFYASGVRPKGQFGSLVLLEGVGSEEEARRFVNHIVYMRRRDVAEYLEVEEEELELAEDFIGYEVVDDEAGVLGVLEGFDDSTQNVLMLIRRADGSELMVPFAEEFITEAEHFDDGGGRLHVSLPEGMVDLN
ncbi:MAG: 16S rRNA processing protein RimM [Bacteroides sp.]|nr:16S rRNA processing protein RimM [Bacteroides sp.]